MNLSLKKIFVVSFVLVFTVSIFAVLVPVEALYDTDHNKIIVNDTNNV